MSDLISWGVDGYGKICLCERYSNKALFCGLLGVNASTLIYIYSEFGDMKNLTPPPDRREG